MKFVELGENAFRSFADKSPYKSFMQTPEIAKYREKSGWTANFLGVKDQSTGKILGASLVVSKPTFLGKKVFIAPGGPLLDYEDKPIVDFFMANLKAYAKNNGGYVLRISPYYELIERDRNGQPKEGGFNHESAVKTLKSLGFKEVALGQPKYMFALDLNGRTPAELMADFKRNTRNHVKKAEKMGVKIRKLKKEELGIFKKITASTSLRRNFTDKPLSYYEDMYDLFVPRNEAMFLVAEADVSRTPESEADVPQAPASETATPQVSVLEARSSDKNSDKTPKSKAASLAPLSAAMFMLYGSEIVYLFSGSDETYMKDYNAQYEIQWHMLKYAAENGFKRYNFYGIGSLPDPTSRSSKNYGIYDFKKGFGGKFGQVLEYLGTYELPIDKKVYSLYQFLSRLKRR